MQRLLISLIVSVCGAASKIAWWSSSVGTSATVFEPSSSYRSGAFSAVASSMFVTAPSGS